jgi:hypothetical protein
MRCPYCHKRPFIFDEEKHLNEGPHRIMTPDGFFDINNFILSTKEMDIYFCKVCGRDFKSYEARLGHMKAHSTKYAKEGSS